MHIYVICNEYPSHENVETLDRVGMWVHLFTIMGQGSCSYSLVLDAYWNYIQCLQRHLLKYWTRQECGWFLFHLFTIMGQGSCSQSLVLITRTTFNVYRDTYTHKSLITTSNTYTTSFHIAVNHGSVFSIRMPIHWHNIPCLHGHNLRYTHRGLGQDPYVKSFHRITGLQNTILVSLSPTSTIIEYIVQSILPQL